MQDLTHTTTTAQLGTARLAMQGKAQEVRMLLTHIQLYHVHHKLLCFSIILSICNASYIVCSRSYATLAT